MGRKNNFPLLAFGIVLLTALAAILVINYLFGGPKITLPTTTLSGSGDLSVPTGIYATYAPATDGYVGSLVPYAKATPFTNSTGLYVTVNVTTENGVVAQYVYKTGRYSQSDTWREFSFTTDTWVNSAASVTIGPLPGNSTEYIAVYVCRKYYTNGPFICGPKAPNQDPTIKNWTIIPFVAQQWCLSTPAQFCLTPVSLSTTNTTNGTGVCPVGQLCYRCDTNTENKTGGCFGPTSNPDESCTLKAGQFCTSLTNDPKYNFTANTTGTCLSGSCYSCAPQHANQTGGCFRVCTDQCMSGNATCFGKQIKTCQVQANGCTDWNPAQFCVGASTVCDNSTSPATCAAPTCTAAVGFCSPTTPSNSQAVAKSCLSGECYTCGTLTHCGNSCVNTQTNASNCGACGTACASGQLCVAGSCQQSSTCNGCSISGTCYTNGTQNPTNTCQWCLNTTSATSWTAKTGTCTINGQAGTCSAGTCTPTCVPKTKTEACGTRVCGSVSDGCAGTISCGTCTSGTCDTNGQCPTPQVCSKRTTTDTFTCASCTQTAKTNLKINGITVFNGEYYSMCCAQTGQCGDLSGYIYSQQTLPSCKNVGTIDSTIVSGRTYTCESGGNWKCVGIGCPCDANDDCTNVGTCDTAGTKTCKAATADTCTSVTNQICKSTTPPTSTYGTGSGTCTSGTCYKCTYASCGTGTSATCCTNGQTCSNGVCTTANACAGCTINGACITTGTADPSNPCKKCDPTKSTSSYSNVADDTQCRLDPIDGLCKSGVCKLDPNSNTGCGGSGQAACASPTFYLDSCDQVTWDSPIESGTSTVSIRLQKSKANGYCYACVDDVNYRCPNWEQGGRYLCQAHDPRPTSSGGIGYYDPQCCIASTEVCGDGQDNDCDGTIDDGCTTCAGNDCAVGTTCVTEGPIGNSAPMLCAVKVVTTCDGTCIGKTKTTGAGAKYLCVTYPNTGVPNAWNICTGTTCDGKQSC